MSSWISLLTVMSMLTVGISARADAGTQKYPYLFWIEGEDFDGLIGRSVTVPEAKKGWCFGWPNASHFSNGGASSEFFAGIDPEAGAAKAHKTIQIPVSGKYGIWTRYEDYLDKPEPFTVEVRQKGKVKFSRKFGRESKTTGWREYKHIWGWEYVWDGADAELDRGEATIYLINDPFEKEVSAPKNIDCVLLTTDLSYVPSGKPSYIRPHLAEWKKEKQDIAPLLAKDDHFVVPKEHKNITIAGRDFWNMTRHNPETFTNAIGLFIKESGRKVSGVINSNTASYKLVEREKHPFSVSRFKADGTDPVAIRKTFGERFLGFGTDEFSYNGLFYDVISGKTTGISTKEKAYNEMQNRYKRSYAPRGGEVLFLCGNPLLQHQACEWGACGLQPEVGENVPGTPNQIAFTRGAARQYHKPWGIHYSSWYGCAVRYGIRDFKSSKKLGARYGFDYGHSYSLLRRTQFLSYMSGANTFVQEEENFYEDRFPELAPRGKTTVEWFDFVQAHPDRGTVYTPVAVMLDHYHGWSWSGMYPRRRTWGVLGFKKGDYMLDEIFDIILPVTDAWAKPLKEESWLTSGPFGDIFDVITSTASADVMSNYKVILLVGDLEARMNKSLAEKLIQYVKKGGTLLINAEQTHGLFPADFLGAGIEDKRHTGNTARDLLDGKRWRCHSYEYCGVKPTTAKPLIVNDGDDSLVIMNKYGKGTVVLSTPAYLLGVDNQALPFVPYLLSHLINGLLPVKVIGDVQYVLNKKPGTWIVTIINNRGIYKTPLSQPTVNEHETADVELVFKGDSSVVREWIENKTLVSKKEGNQTSVKLRIPPGDIRIVEFENP